MGDRTATEAYDVLLGHLRQLHLMWIVEQIQEQVRAGKAITKAVSPQSGIESIRFPEEELDAISSSRGRRQRLASTEPYTDQERLAIAVNAISKAIVQVSEMQTEVVHFFLSESDGQPTIIFEPDEFDESSRLVLETPPTNRKVAVRGLEEVLTKLRTET
jgi:hypothetical protein